MERTHGKVFIASALGAFIGSLVALQLNAYLWWLGLIAGGLVGYLSYEFKAVLRAIPVAWHAASQRLQFPLSPTVQSFLDSVY